MGEDDDRVGQQPAEFAGVVVIVPQVNDEIKAIAAPRSHEHCGGIDGKPRSIRRDQNISGQGLLVQAAEIAQAVGTGFLGHFDQDLRVEAEPAFGANDGFQRLDVDEMLDLVIGSAGP